MRMKLTRAATVIVAILLAATMSSCEQPQVYGSVGYSSYSGGGYYGGGGYGTSIRVGGRIY